MSSNDGSYPFVNNCQVGKWMASSEGMPSDYPNVSGLQEPPLRAGIKSEVYSGFSLRGSVGRGKDVICGIRRHGCKSGHPHRQGLQVLQVSVSLMIRL